MLKTKQIFVLILIFLINAVIVNAATLSDYPDFFYTDNNLNARLVLGEKATAEEVIAATDILFSLGKPRSDIGAAKISSEIQNLYSQNTIIVGNSCSNFIIAEMVGKSTCFPGLKEGEGKILLVEKKGIVVLLVGGFSPLDIRNAGQVLANYKDYKLIGKEIIVRKSSNQLNLEYSTDTDLSNYPYLFIKEGVINVEAVVGDSSSSLNVLAQANIDTWIAANQPDSKIKNRLASEIKDLNRNIISVGNPCINKISAQIAGNPVPCDRDFPAGKGYIRLYKRGDFHHIIVAGKSDEGTKKAAEILANFDENNLKGKEYTITFEEKEENTKNPIRQNDIEVDNNDFITDEKIQPIEKPAKNESTELEKEVETLERESNKSDEKSALDFEEELKEQREISEEVPLNASKDNIFKRFINWLEAWFS